MKKRVSQRTPKRPFWKFHFQKACLSTVLPGSRIWYWEDLRQVGLVDFSQWTSALSHPSPKMGIFHSGWSDWTRPTSSEKSQAPLGTCLTFSAFNFTVPDKFPTPVCAVFLENAALPPFRTSLFPFFYEKRGYTRTQLYIWLLSTTTAKLSSRELSHRLKFSSLSRHSRSSMSQNLSHLGPTKRSSTSPTPSFPPLIFSENLPLHYGDL